MKLMLLTFMAVLAISTEQLYAQDSNDFKVLSQFPSYEETVLHYLKYHDTSEGGNNNFHQFHFMRKPKGWYVLPEFFDPKKEAENIEVEIWNSKSGFTIIPPDGPAEISLPEQYTLTLSNKKRYEFIIHPFYGYTGWDQDVIDYFKKIKPIQMSDHEIYGVAMAYSHRASNIFWAHNLYSDYSIVQSSSIKRSDINKYVRLSGRSISLLQELYSRNPDYSSLVGLIDLKLANQVMSHWYELTLFGQYKKASEFILKYKQPYNDFWAKSSEVLLQNLEKDAIFITNGDNDTYPHLWNQAINNIRRDVLIVNSALLRDPEYFSLLCNNNQALGNLTTGLSQEEIKSLGLKNIVAMNDTAMFHLSYADTELSVGMQSTSLESTILIEYGYYSIPFLNKRLAQDTLLLLNATRRQISIPQFFLSGIIYHHFGLRPIYFMKSIQPDFQQMINPNSLLDEGMVIRLSKDAPNYSGYAYSYFDSDKVEALLESSPVKLPEKKYISRQKFYQLYLEMKSRAISYDINETNSKKKQEEILEYLREYPPQLAGISLHYYNLIYTLFQYDISVDLAQMFLKAYIVELENEIRDMELKDGDPNDLSKLRSLNFIISSIIRSELDPGIPNFYENLFILEKSINKKLRQMPEVRFD